MPPRNTLLAFVFAFGIGMESACAQGWSAGDSPVIGSGSNLTLSTAQPNIVRFTDNGSLTFAAGGCVTITGAVVTAVGSGLGDSGLLTVSGGAITNQGGGTFAVGYSGGAGNLAINAGTLSITTDLLVGSGAGSIGTAVLSGGTMTTRRVWIGNDSATGGLSVASGATWAAGPGDLYIGAYGATGTLSFASGASLTCPSSNLRVGYQAGNGTLTLAPGSTVDLTTNALYVSGNADLQRTNATQGAVWLAGTLKADTVWLTPWFPTGAVATVDSGLIVLQPNGVLQTGYVSKNDRAVSTLRFQGGTLRATKDTSSLIGLNNNGIVRMVIADGQNAIFDTNGKNVTLVAPAAGNQLTLVGDTAPGAVGNGGLVKTGAGALTLRLAADNTFTGAIEVVQGTLDLGRALATNQTVIVQPGATFVMYSSADASKVTVQGAPTNRMLYAVGADTDSLNLSALSGFYDDRLGTTLSGSATLSGTLTHTNTVGSVGSPFRLIGQNGTLNLTNTTLETKAVQIEGPGTFNFMGSRTYTAADAGKLVITDGGFRQDQTFALADASPATPATLSLTTGRFAAGYSLDVGVSGYGAFTANGAPVNAGRLRVGGNTGFTGAFTQSTGTVTLSSESYIGLDGGTGRLSVAGGQFIVNADLRVASNPGLVLNRRPQGEITVSNALLRCNTLHFTSWWTTDGSYSNQPFGYLTLQSGAQAEVNQITKNDDPISTILFDGGLLRARMAQSSFLNLPQPTSTLRLIAATNQYATIDTGAFEVSFPSGSGRLSLTGAGGFKKLGSGRLTYSATDVSYTGNTVVAAGVLRLGNSNQLPDGLGKGNVDIATNAVLDLNGKSETLNRLIGLGSVISTNGPATLGILADGSSDTWQRNWFRGDVLIDKLGTGTLSLAAGNVIATNATVSAGTLRLTSSDGYPYYRFKVEGIKNPAGISPNSMQLSEIALFNNGVNVTTNRTGILYDSTGGIGGTATVNAFPPGEMPEMAVDGIKPADGSANNNKWLDFRAATNRTAADRDRVWLRIDFPSAQKVTHYNWATGNDSPERDPSIFRLQGSYNGADWTDLDLQSNYNATATRNAWVTNTGFAVSSANLPNAINDRANMNVKLGASILLDGVPETLGGLSGYGTVTLSNVNLTLSGSADATATFGGTVNGNGSLIKTGANTQSLFGTNLFAGDVVVQGGTLAVQGGAPATWFRLTIMKNKGNLDVTQFSEFALYSVDGVRRNLSLTQGSGTNSLLQGQFATPVAYSTGSGTEGPDKLFDNATGTKWCLTGNTPYVTNPATYRVVVMRLTNSTPEITGYNFCTANDAPDRSPVTWTLESSPNGVIWTNVDTRTDFVPTTSFFTWYNSSNAFTLANRAVTDGDTDVIPDSSVVEIRSGATLAVNNGSDTIGALRVDMLSAGTLTRLTAKTNGSLYLLNTTGRPASWVIPLSITSVTNPGALKSWKIYANGVQLSGYTLTYDAATGKFRLNAGGTLILVR